MSGKEEFQFKQAVRSSKIDLVSYLTSGREAGYCGAADKCVGSFMIDIGINKDWTESLMVWVWVSLFYGISTFVGYLMSKHSPRRTVVVLFNP